jgi:hypothetical protein
MKKVVILLLALVLVLGLVGCSNKSVEGNWRIVEHEGCQDGFLTKSSYDDDDDSKALNLQFSSDGTGIYSNIFEDIENKPIKYQEESGIIRIRYISYEEKGWVVEKLLLDGNYLYLVSKCENEDFMNIGQVRETENYSIFKFQRVN